jgi:hypothetical protein
LSSVLLSLTAALLVSACLLLLCAGAGLAALLLRGAAED